MDENLKPLCPDGADVGFSNQAKENEALRLLSRSPHPYHRQQYELLQPSDRLLAQSTSNPHPGSDDASDQPAHFPVFAKDSTPATDSGTEADDETYLKRLPPFKAKLHKGLRGRNEALSGPGTPLLTPATEGDLNGISLLGQSRAKEEYKRRKSDTRKRNAVLGRRGAEVAILGSLACLVLTKEPAAALWKKELLFNSTLFATLLSIYPLRLTIRTYLKREHPLNNVPFSIPTTFDPAPALYPQLLTIIVAFLTTKHVHNVVLPNLILGIASIPRLLIPSPSAPEVVNGLHWSLTCVPLILQQWYSTVTPVDNPHGPTISLEDLSLLYPLHQTLCIILRQMTKDSDPTRSSDPTKGSLLPTEIQLLSISLINLWLLAASPQAEILKAILWVGGIGVVLLCGPVVQWSINLARVPKWRLRRNEVPVRPAVPFNIWTLLDFLLSCVFSFIAFFLPDQAKGEFGFETESSAAMSGFTDDEDGPKAHRFHRRCASLQMNGLDETEPLKRAETASVAEETNSGISEPEQLTKHSRRHTLPSAVNTRRPSKTHTPAGRRKRSASSSIRCFFGLTPEEANKRSWQYATWVYLSIVAVIALIDVYVTKFALDGWEPVGWAAGYIFGDLEWFRYSVVFGLGCEDWICLPTRRTELDECQQGWVQQLRLGSYGAANTRLLISCWWAGVVVVGLAIVFQLSKSYEVDTRRKVFHFMMVSMFLPAIFVDPAWCSLALTIVLAIFLLLDMLRASQLPPLSTPIKIFLQPYVDGRDYQGPVVVSHIFLLIGCAIPLWLSLASLPRAGVGCLRGWEIPTRELSMVSGVVCVGLGDAAASLIGRRWGVRKWWWGGGKSLEGSLAFAVAVFAGLLAANVWLKIGGWPITNYSGNGLETTPYRGLDALWEGFREHKWSGVVLNTGVCATMASLTEAVLTGGNDNVVVPVVLWTCVKATGL
ncbi:dolichol kinase [Gnomoniopsis smithogilvyi]|uniref:dolichol kinase n=1 Tax=Gnomoniopsis smithogilvyi TaxID=1191159 RepID=A0A9W8YNK1_9PEZI|nr:dolichol kinase [Gnomoniopsis smithogilvyi]